MCQVVDVKEIRALAVDIKVATALAVVELIEAEVATAVWSSMMVILKMDKHV